MRHRRHRSNLNRTTAHRAALMRNLACALLEHGLIKTTEPKGKQLRRFVDGVITIAKDGLAANDEYVLADGEGRLFAFNDRATELWVIDVKRNKRAHVEAAWFEGLRATRLEKDGTFLLLRATDSDEQLVRVDASALLRN